MTNFLPDTYSVPKAAGKYMKFAKGENKFRVISKQPIIGYEYWTNDSKPVRSKERWTSKPADMRVNEGFSWDSAIKHFWAFVVWNQKEELIQVLEITQSSIQNELTTLFKNEDWGHPSGYDVTITRTGDGMETRYTVMPSPKKELSITAKKASEDTPVNLDALYSGDDPFATGEPMTEKARVPDLVEPPQGITIDEIPF